MRKLNNKYYFPVIMSVIICIVLFFIPTGFEGASNYQRSHAAKVKVLEVDNSLVRNMGVISTGEQICDVEILEGPFKNEVSSGINMLIGSLEQDKLFQVGDTALVRINEAENKIITISMIDHHRINAEIILLLSFFAFLILFAKGNGIRAIISFVLSVLMIWKALIPLYLKGYDPIITGAIIIGFLTIMIISLVFGFDKRCLAAISGSIAGIIVTGFLSIWVTNGFRIHGAVIPYAESLLYGGYGHLDLTKIFMACIFIGSSGAMMDLAVDVTSAIQEVVTKRPDLCAKEAIQSGFRVGRAAMGTMTTTLLLAYSGGFIGLMMVFMAQGTPIINILNFKYVAAEYIHTVVGSFGLVLVAPFTAVAAGFLLTKKNQKQTEEF